MHESASFAAGTRRNDREPIDRAGDCGAESPHDSQDRAVVACRPEQLVIRSLADQVEDPTADKKPDRQHDKHGMDGMRLNLCARLHQDHLGPVWPYIDSCKLQAYGWLTEIVSSGNRVEVSALSDRHQGLVTPTIPISPISA